MKRISFLILLLIVAGSSLTAQQTPRPIIITETAYNMDTGSRSSIPPIEGLTDVNYICAENWLEANELPKHLAIIGGGYIGLEMSQFYRRMGSEATVIDEGQRIVGHEDQDISLAMQKLLENEGIEFHSNAHVQRIQNDKGVIKLAIQRNNQ